MPDPNAEDARTPIEKATSALAVILNRISTSRLGKLTARETDVDIFAMRDAAAALRALIAEHERLTADMHQRELHHFETEKLLTEAGIDPDAVVPADDEREALAQAALDTERLRQIAEWMSMDHGHEETAKRVSLIAARHDRLAAGLRRPGTITEETKRLVYEVRMMLSSVASHGPAALTTTHDPKYTANLLARLRDALVAADARAQVTVTDAQVRAKILEELAESYVYVHGVSRVTSRVYQWLRSRAVAARDAS